MLVPAVLAAAGIGFFSILMAYRKLSGKTISYEPAVSKEQAYVSNVAIPKNFTAELINSAKRWSKERGIPVQEVLATIYVESRGKPTAWANLETEDSRGLMQVNVT
jgi:soluble lytic murein transglycosylase-like protein